MKKRVSLKIRKNPAAGGLWMLALCICIGTVGAKAQPADTIAGHEYVDLGLSVKWATCNVGAEKPEDYGDYYAWGETEAKSSYTKANSKTHEKSMSDIAGDPQYDAARKNWGGTWRLPTKAEIEELLNDCKWTWTTKQENRYGYEVTGPNGKSIFLPAAGSRNLSAVYFAGAVGYYWTSTPVEDNADKAYRLGFDSGVYKSHQFLRSVGYSIRPVSE